jgi:hypothetical protein
MYPAKEFSQSFLDDQSFMGCDNSFDELSPLQRKIIEQWRQDVLKHAHEKEPIGEFVAPVDQVVQPEMFNPDPSVVPTSLVSTGVLRRRNSMIDRVNRF